MIAMKALLDERTPDRDISMVRSIDVLTRLLSWSVTSMCPLASWCYFLHLQFSAGFVVVYTANGSARRPINRMTTVLKQELFFAKYCRGQPDRGVMTAVLKRSSHLSDGLWHPTGSFLEWRSIFWHRWITYIISWELECKSHHFMDDVH